MNEIRPLRERMRDAGLIPADPPAQPATPIRATVVGSSYGDTALHRETDAVAHASEGVRNHTLNRAAFNLGQLVDQGHLRRDTVVEALTAAARQCGLDPVEITRTITSGFAGSEAKPRARVTLVTDRDTTTFDTPVGVTVTGDGVGDETTDDGWSRYKPGGEFIFDVPEQEAAVWGNDTDVLWAAGEALMIVGPPGVGKTTLAQQLTLARAGMTPALLGFPVAPTTSRVLYLAMDRPRQIARSLRRMVDEDDRPLLDQRLIVWPGPPPADVAKHPGTLRALAERAEADTIVVDSVKDAAVGLTDSETAGWYNRARQHALAAGIEVLEVAHQVKKGAAGAAPKTLADVHGGMELTAGVGSVFLVWGDAGDLVVELRHLKQPSDLVGPLKLLHDHEHGRTTVFSTDDPVVVLQNKPNVEWAPREVAVVVTEKQKPTEAEVERIRRRLAAAAKNGLIERVQAPSARSVSGFEQKYVARDASVTVSSSYYDKD